MVVTEGNGVRERDSKRFQKTEESFRFGNAGERGDRGIGQFGDWEDLAVTTDSVENGFDFEGGQPQVRGA